MKLKEKNKQQKGSMYIFNISFSQDFDFKKNRFRRWKKSEKIYNWSQWASLEIKKIMAKEWYWGFIFNFRGLNLMRSPWWSDIYLWHI